MKTRVKKDTCIGCGACTVIADKIFQIWDDVLAETIESNNSEKILEVEDSEKENVIDASESCPTGAIEIIEE